MKVHSYFSQNEVVGIGEHHLVWCIGCKGYHSFDSRWTYNRDPLNPTFSPSLLVEQNTKRQCHSYVKNGKWEYLSDCHHELAGQTVDMIDVNF